MAYDELVARDDVSERRMFGGLTFMVGGHMCCGVLEDRLVLRLGEEGASEALSEPFTHPMDLTGRFADAAPDILMEPAEGYSLTHAKSAIEDADWVSGDHRMDGVIVAAGPRVTPFTKTPKLIDMAPTILAALHAPAGIKHTGSVLAEVVGSEASVEAGDACGLLTAGEESTVSDTEADEMEEHLRGLGYLE